MRIVYMQAVKTTSSKKKVQSIEPNIADTVNGWLRSYKLDYKLEQESLNDEIDKFLNAFERLWAYRKEKILIKLQTSLKGD